MATQCQHGTHLSTLQFNYHDKKFVAEASELGGCPEDRVYPDACDVGFILESHKTRKAVWFYLSQQHFDRDGDLLVTIYKPTAEAIKRVPQLKDVEVHILND